MDSIISALPIHNTNDIWLLKAFAASWKTSKALLLSAFFSSSLFVVFLFSQLISYSQIQGTENSGLLKTYESTKDFSFKILADNTWFVADSKAKLIFMTLFFLISLIFFLHCSFFWNCKRNKLAQTVKSARQKTKQNLLSSHGFFLILQLIP